MNSGEDLTISEAAKIIGVHPNTLRRWEKEKKLVPVRNKISRYRYYSYKQIRDFLARGGAKIRIKWGYYSAKISRVEELSLARKSIDALVSFEATTYETSADKELLVLLKEAVKSGVKVRFIRNLSSPEMKLRAELMEKLGVETKHQPIKGLTFSIRDGRVVRIEIPNESNRDRLNLIIHDSKIAYSFSLLFDKLWNES